MSRVRAKMISLPMIRVSYSLIALRTCARTSCRLPDEAGRQVVLQTADAAIRVVHARAGARLHQVLDHLPLAEGVEDRRHGAELERIGAAEHQVAQDAVPLRHHRADPLRAIRHLDAGEPLHGDRPAELVVERADPVVAVHQDEDLAGVADLGELLGAAVHVPDDRLGAGDDLAVELEDDAQDPVRRRCCGPMLRIISSVEKSPAGTTSMSRPPPRIMEVTWELWKAGRSCISCTRTSYRGAGLRRRACAHET